LSLSKEHALASVLSCG